MYCPTEQDLQRMHDSELPSADAGRVRSHVAGCEACKQVLAAYSALGETLRSAPLPVPAPTAMRQWMQPGFRSVQVRRDEAVRKLAGWMTMAAAAAILIAVVTGRQGGSTEISSVALSPWETAMLTPANMRGETESSSVQLAAANWITADLWVDQGERTWR